MSLDTDTQATLDALTTDQQAALETLILAIAQQEFLVTTLEARRWDRLDFHEVPVWSMRDALIRAYLAGRKSAKA